MIRAIVLTSRENFSNYSSQEIVPYIESAWESLNSEDFETVVYNIDAMTLAELTPKLLGADRIVVTCFNYRMCKVMEYIRQILKLNLNFIVHAHNLSTIAFWPYRYFASSDLFFTSDSFITSCENDKKLLEQVFKGPRVHVVPYLTKIQVKLYKESLLPPKNIIYVGRISPQKNLHNVLLAYSFLKKAFPETTPSFIVFGKEDHQGSPNMNLRNDSYMEFLVDLTQRLGIQGDVYFKGHVDRELIEDFLNLKPNLFVSASLLSDETFGMAALESLLTRNRTLLSDWGGHCDFKKHFPDLVDLMPVSQSEFGPTLSADVIAKTMKKNLTAVESSSEFKVDSYYSREFFADEYKKAASYEFGTTPLPFSELADQIYEAKMDFTSSSTQIFSSFADPLFHKMAYIYIGDQPEPECSPSNFHYSAVPWMVFNDGIFMIDDPQKGPLLIQNDNLDDRKYLIQFEGKNSVAVSAAMCERLFKCGYINTGLAAL